MPLLNDFSRWQPRGTIDDITPYASQPFTLPVAPQSWWGDLANYAGTGAQQLSRAFPEVQDVYRQAKSGDVLGAAGQALGGMEFATPYKKPGAAALGLLGQAFGFGRRKDASPR